MSGDENPTAADQQIIGSRARILAVLIATLVIGEVSKDVACSSGLGGRFPSWHTLYCAVLGCSPFLLAKIAPKAAGFDVQWLPSSRRQWLWFLGMLFLLFASYGLVAALAATIVGRPPRSSYIGPAKPLGIVIEGITIVVIAPVAEEIFFRGYVLEQLRKLTRSGVALLIQSLLFGLWHLYTRGLFSYGAVFSSVHAFLFGIILGAWRIRFRSLLPLVLAHALFNAHAIVYLKARYDEVVGGLHPKYTISKETTCLTEPLRKDGSVDYAAALNQRFGQGVTSENNAAVLFWRAVGPEAIRPEYRDKYFQKYFQMLGIPPLPEEGEYFVGLDHYVSRRENDVKPPDAKPEAGAQDDTKEQLKLAAKRPWSEQEFPVLAEWLAANDKPLAILVEASKRPRNYDPLCCGEKTPLIAVLRPASLLYYDVARALRARAMLRVNEGRLDEAWADLLTCHRLARLAGQGPTVIDAVGARGLDVNACTADQAFLQYAPLTAAQIAKMREDLDRLPSMPEMADRVGVAERFTYLDTVSDYSRQGAASLAGFAEVPFDEVPEPKGLRPDLKQLKNTIKSLVRYGASAEIDWDLILRMGSSWFDRIADAYRQPTRAEQRESLRKVDEDLRRLEKTAADAESLDKLMLEDPRQALSERFSQVLLTIFLPDVTACIHVEDRGIMQFELDRLAFALASYRADHGAYPANLAELVPNYVVEVPKDIFNDDELHYRLEGEGYVLYSVGINGKDDGARGLEDRRKDEDWDDLVVRVPAPNKEE